MQAVFFPNARIYRAVHRFVLIIFSITILVACSKDSDGDDDELPPDARQVAGVVPASSLKTATDHDFHAYSGTTPPDIQGTFKISPLTFDYDNFSEPNAGLPVGYNLGDVEITFAGQKDDQSIQVSFKGFLPGQELTESFVAGSGNNFSVCFKTQLFGGQSALFSFPYVYVFSGTRDGNRIKNLEVAVFGLKTTADTQGYSVEGNVTLYSDSNGSSELIP